jgi:hypothetical protein
MLYEKLASPAGFLTHAALFAEKSARIDLEEVVIFEGTFAHHPTSCLLLLALFMPAFFCCSAAYGERQKERRHDKPSQDNPT